MQVSNNNLNFLSSSIQIEKRVSFLDVDHLMSEAIQHFDENKAINLLDQGANPNQMVPLTKEVIVKYLKEAVPFCDCNGEVHDIDAYNKELESDETYEATIREFFDGIKEIPALYFALMFRQEDLAIKLIDKGASSEFSKWAATNVDEDDIANYPLVEIAELTGCEKVFQHLQNNPQI